VLPKAFLLVESEKIVPLYFLVSEKKNISHSFCVMPPQVALKFARAHLSQFFVRSAKTVRLL